MTARNASDARILSRWRREFTIPKTTTFLNNASFGPVPRSARRAVEELFRKQADFRGDPDVDAETFSLLEQSRGMFAQLTGAHCDRVAFVPNASFGHNAILFGLGLKPGERVLVPENEFPALVYAVRSLCEKLALTMVPIKCPNGRPDRQHLELELRRGAAVLAISWVQFFNGFRNDLKSLTQLCHAHSCFVLADLSQGAGVIPFDMADTGVDAIACGTQKWLLGQTGGGFFAVTRTPVRPVVPQYAGWLGYDWGYDWSDLQRWDRPELPDGRAWEVGTYPFYSVRMVHAGLRILTSCGADRIFRHVETLHARLIAELEGSPYRAAVFTERANRSAIITIAGPDTVGLHRFLSGKRVFVSLREGNIRVSPHFYNTNTDIDRLCKLVRLFGEAHQ